MMRAARRSLRAWGRRQLYSFFSSLGTLVGHRLGTFMTVLVLGIAMVLPLGLWVTLDNLRSLDLRQQDWSTITVFLKPGIDEETANDLAARIARERGASVQTVSPEQGMAEFARESGFGQALDALDENPLPWVLLVTPQNDEGVGLEQSATALAGWLESVGGVDLVRMDAKWLKRLAAILRFGDAIVAVLAVMFSLAVVVVVANTIRLDVAAHADEIEVLNLVGASSAFIRQPFLYSGFWYGLLGAFLALLLLAAALLYLAGPLDNLLDAYGRRFEVRGPGPGEALEVLFAGAGLGLIGAWVAVRRYLRQFRLPDPRSRSQAYIN